MSRRTASWLAWIMWALSLALTALGLLLLVVNSSRADVPIYPYWKENVLEWIGFSTTGALIVSRTPHKNPIGWLFCAVGFLGAVEHLVGEYANYALLAAPGSLPVGEAAAWIASWIWVLDLGLYVFIGLLFPDGRLLSDRWKWFARLSVLLTLAAMLLAAFSPGPISTVLPYIHNPLGIEGLPNVYKPVQAFMLILIAVAISSLLVRRLYTRGVVRQQIKWFAYASAVTATGVIFRDLISEPVDVVWLGWLGEGLTMVGLVGLPIAMGIAITRYRLYDIDLIINRTLVYGPLTLALVAFYFGVIVVLQRLFVLLTGQQSTLAVVASTLLIAALFSPLRRSIQSFIDRSFYRRKYDAAKTLEGFSMKLRDETDLKALSDDLVGVVRETMQPAHVSLWLRPDPRKRRSEGPE